MKYKAGELTGLAVGDFNGDLANRTWSLRTIARVEVVQ